MYVIGTVIEHLTVKDRIYKFYQTEGAFSQPNAVVCEKMITWAMDLCSPKALPSSSLTIPDIAAGIEV